MLDRIKKKQYEGFKEFVQNMEVTAVQVRQQIFLTGVLEDPVFMAHVMKNLKTFEDILSLPTDDIDAVFKKQASMVTVFAKALLGSPVEKLKSLETFIPKWTAQIKDELSYLQGIAPQEQETAKFFVMKALRKLQREEVITGFRWNLPPQEVFIPKTYPDGKCQIQFENGVLAAEGQMIKNRRIGFWRHYYDSGKILGEGEYSESLKTGSWVFYHSSGLHKAQGKYKTDLKEGFWKEWDRNGNMEEVEYHEGVRKV